MRKAPQTEVEVLSYVRAWGVFAATLARVSASKLSNPGLGRMEDHIMNRKKGKGKGKGC